MNLIAGKEAITSFNLSVAPMLVRSKSRYYLKQKEKNIVEFPENKKQLINSFPDLKDQFTNFIESNKLDFDNEADLIKIIIFLRSL